MQCVETTNFGIHHMHINDTQTISEVIFLKSTEAFALMEYMIQVFAEVCVRGYVHVCMYMHVIYIKHPQGITKLGNTCAPRCAP